LTWAQLGLHRKPWGLLNIRGYYRRLIDFLGHAVAEQLLKAAYRALLLVEERPERLLDRFEGHLEPAASPADGAGTPP
jgi:predicted Rossmann-fold nucleotide-binding protein